MVEIPNNKKPKDSYLFLGPTSLLSLWWVFSMQLLSKCLRSRGYIYERSASQQVEFTAEDTHRSGCRSKGRRANFASGRLVVPFHVGRRPLDALVVSFEVPYPALQVIPFFPEPMNLGLEHWRTWVWIAMEHGKVGGESPK